MKPDPGSSEHICTLLGQTSDCMTAAKNFHSDPRRVAAGPSSLTLCQGPPNSFQTFDQPLFRAAWTHAEYCDTGLMPRHRRAWRPAPCTDSPCRDPQEWLSRLAGEFRLRQGAYSTVLAKSSAATQDSNYQSRRESASRFDPRLDRPSHRSSASINMVSTIHCCSRFH